MNLENYRAHFIRRQSDMNESPLESNPIKSYRLTISYSWGRDTWIYRIEKTDDSGVLILKKTYSDSYKEYSGLPDTTISRVLDQVQWDKIEKTFNSNCFWTMQMKINRRGLDGRTCVLEAYDPEKANPINLAYFTAARWSPKENTNFRNICDVIESLDNTE